jgi:acyl-CoA synthetase (NDP forming)
MRVRAKSELASFLSPRSIAIIGASPDVQKIRGALLQRLRHNGFPGEILPVNPSYDEIAGLRCYPRVAGIDGGADLAIIAIPAASVIPALEECAAARVRNAVIISSGFAEDERAPPGLQDRIAALARRSGMRICGPNSEGFHNEVAKVTATFSPAVEAIGRGIPIANAKRVAVIAQSGGIGFALHNRGRALGLSFSAVVSTGNEADLSAADFFEHFIEDPDTAGVLLFLESIRDPATFVVAAEAASAALKPVVAIKVGRSLVGSKAAISHTASLAGWDAGYDALFRRHGIALAADLDEGLSVLAALMTNPPARGRRIAVLTVSGGAGALAADALTLAGLDVAELSAPTQAAIQSFIPSYGATRNPVDLTAQGAHGGGTLRAAELLLEDEAIDMIAIVTSLASPTRATLDKEKLKELLQRRRKPMLVHSYTLPSELGLRNMAEAGVVVLGSMTLLATAARALLPGRPAPPTTRGVLPQAVAARLDKVGNLTEHEAKLALADYGRAIAPCRLIAAEAELDRAGAELGFPLALKIQSRDIAHKSEIGGVRLGISDVANLRRAYREVLAAAHRHARNARIEGVLLEPMAPAGVEMIVGILRDPVVGPVVTLGAGGVAAELYGDSAHRLAPVDEEEAIAMLAELRMQPLLRGYRGAPAADIAALARLVAGASRLAFDAVERIAELELNPVIVHPAGQGCTIADALIVVRPLPDAIRPEGA